MCETLVHDFATSNDELNVKYYSPQLLNRLMDTCERFFICFFMTES